VPGAQVAAEGRVDVELLQARERVEKRVVVVVRVVAAAVERELVAAEVERVDEVPVAAPRAVPCGGCREAALEQVVHVAPQQRLGWIDGGEAEQRGVEARRVERRRRQRLPRGSGRHDAPERGGERGRADEHDEYEHRERAPQRPLHRRRQRGLAGSELHRGARMSEWRGRRGCGEASFLWVAAFNELPRWYRSAASVVGWTWGSGSGGSHVPCSGSCIGRKECMPAVYGIWKKNRIA
jgi:hypothetical protein